MKEWIYIKNYFELVNRDYLDDNFKLESRIDPDSKCYELYTDLKKELFCKNFPNGDLIRELKEKERTGKNGSKYWELVIKIESGNGEKKYFGLGTDYIGASVNWALKCNVSQKVIKEYLKVSRTLGGHIFFPRWQISNNKERIKSLNIARGGEFISNKRPGFYDRFDIFLYDLKNWYDDVPSQLKKEFDSNKKWLELFVDFKGFINYFSLNNFLNSEYEVIDLTDSMNVIEKFKSYIPKEPSDYSLYFKNSSNIIIKRFKDGRN